MGSSPTTPILHKYQEDRFVPMKYLITTSYAWYNRGEQLILLYCIQNIPFTFDELPEIVKQNPEIIEKANSERSWEVEDLYNASRYLIMEECHPLMNEIELENPELMPADL